MRVSPKKKTSEKSLEGQSAAEQKKTITNLETCLGLLFTAHFMSTVFKW